MNILFHFLIKKKNISSNHCNNSITFMLLQKNQRRENDSFDSCKQKFESIYNSIIKKYKFACEI